MRFLLIKRDAQRDIYAVASDDGMACELLEFLSQGDPEDFDGLEAMQEYEKDVEKLLAMLQHFSETGRIPYRNAVKDLKGRHAEGLKEFRPNNLRVLWFSDPDNGRVVICTHGFVKKGDDTPPGDIARAQKLRKRYIKEIGSHLFMDALEEQEK